MTMQQPSAPSYAAAPGGILPSGLAGGGPAGIGRLALVAGLALRDLLHEKRLTLCSVLGIAAVLAPLMVLFGLKHGVIEGLRSNLVEDPRARMLVSTAHRDFDQGFFTWLAARPEVGFVVPRTLFLNEEARFERPDRRGSVARAAVLATGPGDPLLPGLPRQDLAEVIPSASLSARLDLQPGMALTLRATRGAGATQEVLELPLSVSAVAPPAAAARDAVFVAVPLMLLVENFKFGLVPASAGLADAPQGLLRPAAGFRVHARRLEDVVSLDHALRQAGIEVESRAGDVAGLLGLDRDLGLLFALVAGLSGLGTLAGLGIGFYANVERKQRQLAVLRLVGLARRDLLLLPILQALSVAMAGTLLAGIVAYAVAGVVNRLPLGEAAGMVERPVCVLEPYHLLLAALATLAGAALAAGFAGARAARTLPTEGLRDA